MATYTSTKTGNWSDSTVWGGTPTAADAVIIANTHTVTLDTTGCVCLSLTVNSGGTLAASTTANSDLTIGNATGDTVNLVASTGATINIDLSAAAAYSCTIYLNKGANTSGLGVFADGTSNVTLKGATRKRLTRLNGAITAGAASATVDNATGWVAGDVVVLGTTQPYNATPRIDIITLDTVNTGTGAITWTGGITYDHADNCYVGNFSSNLTVRPYGTNRAYCVLNGTVGLNVQDVAFNGLADSTTFGRAGFSINTGPTSGGILNNNAFYTAHASNGSAVFLRFLGGPITRNDNIIYCSVGTAIGGQSSSGYTGNWERLAIFRSPGSGLNLLHPGEQFIDSVAMACLNVSGGGVASGGYGSKIVGGSIIACNNGVYTGIGALQSAVLETTKIGTEFGAYNGSMFRYDGVAFYATSDCEFQTSGTLLNGLVNASKPTYTGVAMVNKDLSITTQEEYYPHCEIKRNNSTTKRSTSGISVKPVRLATDSQRTQSILCANGSSIRVIGYVQFDTSFYNANDYTAPTVVISGNGITPVTFTASSAANGAWELYDLSATNSSGSDGNFTLTYTANAKTVMTGTVYFDGVPDAPFVTKCRHYGYTYDESNPIRTVNATISATEANALLLGDTEITVTAATSAIALNASRTLQQVYDYTQAWACTTANLSYAVPLTGVGIAGSPSLFAVGNITTTGFTLNGSGSLSMGSKTLTSSLPWVYTYTGGTFSQAATVPTFSGGTLNIGAAGTYTFTQAASMTVSATPTSASTYVLSGGTFTGTLTFHNTSAHNIIVEVPAGTTTSSTGSPGSGTITFSAPQIYQSVTLTGVTAGSRVQIYDTTSSTELYNGTPTFPYTWTDSVAAAADRAIRLRVSYVSGVTAKEFIDASIGTCGQTSGTAAVSYLANQSNDTTYNSNGINGPSIYATSGLTFTDASPDRVNCNIAGGSVTWPTIYACFVYWNFTATGIANDFTYVAAPDTANYLLSGMKIRNTSATDLMVISGYGRDATSGLSKDIIDTAGSTGNIFLAPDHVVAYQTTGTYAITGDISTVLAAIPSAASNAAATLSAAQATPIKSDIQTVRNQALTGVGTTANPWNPA